MERIDSCQKQDIQGILNLYHQLHPGEDCEITPPRQAAFNKILDDNNSHLLVAKDGEKVIATAHLTILNNLSRNGKPSAYVENVVVDKDCRGKGLGEKLIATATAKAEELGCYKIFLCTGTINNGERDKDMEKRHKFYRKTGLQEGIKHGFVRYLNKR